MEQAWMAKDLLLVFQSDRIEANFLRETDALILAWLENQLAFEAWADARPSEARKGRRAT